MDKIAELLQEKGMIEARLAVLNYGSIEVRQQDSKQYIYTHFRNGGLLSTRYIGEYSTSLYNLILENNAVAKGLKKRLREINKALGQMQYSNAELSEDVKINIDLARRNMVESIYKQAMLEGVATTYSDTETIINGGKVKDMTASDVTKVVNLKHAWEFILDPGVISCNTNYAILCQINSLVEEGFSYTAGKLRTVPVTIGGSTYIPPIPFESKVKEDLDCILNSNESAEEKGIDLLLYSMKKQLFLDGNKRTAVIFANHYLIGHASGIIVVPAELVPNYKKVLIDYYEDKNEDIKDFLRTKCIQRIR